MVTRVPSSGNSHSSQQHNPSFVAHVHNIRTMLPNTSTSDHPPESVAANVAALPLCRSPRSLPLATQSQRPRSNIGRSNRASTAGDGAQRGPRPVPPPPHVGDEPRRAPRCPVGDSPALVHRPNRSREGRRQGDFAPDPCAAAVGTACGPAEPRDATGARLCQSAEYPFAEAEIALQTLQGFFQQRPLSSLLEAFRNQAPEAVRQ